MFDCVKQQHLLIYFEPNIIEEKALENSIHKSENDIINCYVFDS